MISLLLVIVYILLLLGVIFVERKEPTEAILWVTIVACLPYVGSLLYLIFGSTFNIKLTAFLRRRRLSSEYRKRIIQTLEVQRSFSPESDENSVSDVDKQVMRFNHVYNYSPVTGYLSANFFIDGESHYKQLFADIGSSRSSIHLQFYTIHNDVVGRALVDLLAKKAKEGVKVWVMFDYIANFSVPKSMYAPLVDAGGIVKRLKPYLTHFRSHRKIVAIDGKIGYIGGMNIGKQYAGLGKKKTPWRDTQIRLTGPCVTLLDQIFLTDWVCALTQSQLSRLKPDFSLPAQFDPDTKSDYCQFVLGGVDNDREGVKMCYLSMIRSARHSIRIQSPYFIPDASVLDALKTAAASGVQIQLMIPGIKASFFLDPVTTHYCSQLLEFGAEIYKYKGYIHAKTMIIDDELCCCGSVNLDIRSLKVDDEICGVFYDNGLVRSYIDIFSADTGNCIPYTCDDAQKRTGWQRALENIFLLFAPLM